MCYNLSNFVFLLFQVNGYYSTMTDNEPIAPLTAADVERQVRETMMQQQTAMLEIAGRNALQLVRDEQRKSAPTLLDAIESEFDDKRAHDSHDWRTNVNRDNFNALYEIEQMWKKTERFVGSLEVSPEQAELKASATAAIEKGKGLTHQRLKVIKFADRDGWQAALHFVGDNIAESPEEAKRMIDESGLEVRSAILLKEAAALVQEAVGSDA